MRITNLQFQMYNTITKIYILKNISIKAHHNNINKMPYRKNVF